MTIRAKHTAWSSSNVISITDETGAYHRFMVRHITGWSRQATTVYIHTTTGSSQPIRCPDIEAAADLDDQLTRAIDSVS